MVRLHELTYVLEPIDAVRQHPDNPNNGDDEEVAVSMEINGVYKGVTAQRSTGYILEGHTRYVALKRLNSEHIFVSWLDVDDATALRILLVDNESARKAWIDKVMLGELLEEMQAADPLVGLLGTGYNLAYLEELREMQMDSPLEFDEKDFAKQRGTGHAITCPACGHEFGGGR
jgi:ParB-like chromosome segregation protein Spo0J